MLQSAGNMAMWVWSCTSNHTWVPRGTIKELDARVSQFAGLRAYRISPIMIVVQNFYKTAESLYRGKLKLQNVGIRVRPSDSAAGTR